MSTSKRMEQMAHLKQKKISDNSCKSIIIDALLESVCPLTQVELAAEITSLFHILISSERLDELIDTLSAEGVLYFDSDSHIKLEPTKEVEFRTARAREIALRDKAICLWLDYIHSFQDISLDLEDMLTRSLPVFLRSLFIKHGVSSYQLLLPIDERLSFGVTQIAHDISLQFGDTYKSDIEKLLPTIFQASNHAEVVEYLKHNIEKAVGYICEVISDENLLHLTEDLKSLTVYLDTNVVYRLLNLQGQSRYNSIKRTLSFCREHGVKLRISALTKKELINRLSYDAKVLLKFPIKTNLSQAGYHYRTSDNYVSTYWSQARRTGISTEDFIGFYNSFDVLLAQDGVECEDIEVDEASLIESAKSFYERMSKHDENREKSDPILWHDAYNFAYVQKMQKITAKSALDSQCLFLTTDQALTMFQREDHDMKGHASIAITPTQLLQMFAFSRPDSGYEETFIEFFASSSLGVTFQYNNDDIQEILSRISHYQGVNTEVAEKVLARALRDSRYLVSTSDEEREEIIYNSVSEELTTDLKLTKEQVATLEQKNSQLGKDYEAAYTLLTESDEQHEKDRCRLEEEARVANKQRDDALDAFDRAEKEMHEVQEYSTAQERLYVNEKWEKWRKWHLFFFLAGIVSTAIIIGASFLFWKRTGDTGYFSLLGLLAISIPLLAFGAKVFFVGCHTKIHQAILNDYHKKLNK